MLAKLFPQTVTSDYRGVLVAKWVYVLLKDLPDVSPRYPLSASI